MNISKSELSDTLAKLKPGLAQRDLIEQNVCFCFHNISITTFNDNIFISVPFHSQIEGGVRAEELYQLILRAPNESVEISKQNNEFQLQSGSVKAGIAMIEVEHPAISPAGEWQPFSEELRDAIDFASFSVSSNMTNPKFTCIHVKDTAVMSSDGYRLTKIHLSEASPFNFLLPGMAAPQLKGYTFTHILVDPSWIHFKDESGILFSVRRMADDFFDEAKLEEYSTVEGPTVRLPDMTQAIERCSLMADNSVPFETKIGMKFEENKVICRGQKIGGWVEEELTLEYTGNPFRISINPNSLNKILVHSSDMIVGPDRCLFQGDNFKHVVMLAEDRRDEAVI